MGKKLIKTTLPKNLNGNELYVFKKEFYKMPLLKNKLVKNVFLTHYRMFLKYVPIKYTLPNAFGYRM